MTVPQLRNRLWNAGIVRFVTAAFALVVAHQPFAQDQTVAVPHLTRIEQVRSLAPVEAQREYPVRVKGVVTYYDREWKTLFVQDNTGGIYVRIDSPPELKLGQLIEVEGVTDPGEFSPIIVNPTIKIAGDGTLPTGRRLTLEQLSSGREDAQWVEVEGVIRSMTNHWDHLYMDVAWGNNRAKVLVPDFKEQALPKHLIGAGVRLTGVCAALFNHKRQMVGFQLLMPSLEYMTVRRPAVDPTSLPVRRIQTLMSFKMREAFQNRVRVQGVVTLHQPGRALYIKDKTAGLQVQTSETTAIRVGDSVDVVGFLRLGEHVPVLQDGLYRSIGTGELISPIPVEAAELVRGKFDAELVEMETMVLQHLVRINQAILVCQSGAWVFEAILQTDGGLDPFEPLRNGSRVKVTGVCSVQDREGPTPFRLLLRTPNDVVVVQQASWWTRQRVQAALVLTLIATLAAMIWLGVLRHRVKQQTEVIRKNLAEEAALEERFRDLFENASDLIFTHDLQGNLTSINKAGERLTGYSRAEFVQLNLAEIVEPEQRDWVHMIEAKIAEGARTTYELEIRAKDGRRIFLEVSSRVSRPPDAPPLVQSIARDVTSRKQAEEAIQKLNQELERRVLERTANLKETNEQMEAFCYTVSHDLRAPLRAMQGFSQALSEDFGPRLDDVGQDYVRRIMDSAQRMDVLIQDLLTYSRLSRAELPFEVVNIEAVLDSVLPLFNQELQSKQALITVERPLPRVRAHGLTVETVLSNLISNALKFIAPGAVPQLRIWAEERNTKIRVCVQDNGIGIEPQYQERIFQVFERLHPSHRFSGTGIGLAIVKKGIERMDGTVGVESKLGEGSCFWFELPKVESSVSAPVAEANRKPTEAVASF
ncbi:MAG: PAS domain S-box protein [Verrucomicrobiota bacterium]